MSFRPDTNMKRVVQDMPPPGGFPGVRIDCLSPEPPALSHLPISIQVDLLRTARARGPSGLQIWLMASFGIAYGFYRVGVRNRQVNGERMAEREAQYAMAPFLQAEEDAWYHAREQYIMEKEAAIMKDVPDWKVGESTYFTQRWVPRQTAFLDKNVKK